MVTMCENVPLKKDLPGKKKYIALSDILRSEIEAGVYPLGSTIPKQAEYAQKHGVARETVRNAYILLEKEGIIKQIKNKGSVVLRRYPWNNKAQLDYIFIHKPGEEQGAFGAVYFSSILGAIIEECNRESVSVQCHLVSQEEVGDYTKIAGLIREGAFIAGSPPGKTLKMLTNSGINLCLLLHSGVPYGISSVQEDNYGGIEALFDHLFNLGHRNICFVRGENNAVTSERRVAYMKVLHKKGLSERSSYIFEMNDLDYSNRNHFQDVFKKELLSFTDKYREITAFICAQPNLACLLKELIHTNEDFKLRNFSLCGMPTTEMTQMGLYDLTTATFSTDEIGCKAARVLLDTLGKESVNPVHLVCSYFLRTGSSSFTP
jgi:DNA-binding LacI/PurR family transcriptional regulator